MIWGPGRNVSRDQLASFRVPHGDHVDGARVTCAEQFVPGRLLRILECGRTGPLYPGDAGSALAETFGVPVVARIPFHSAAFPPAELTTLSDAVAAVFP